MKMQRKMLAATAVATALALAGCWNDDNDADPMPPAPAPAPAPSPPPVPAPAVPDSAGVSTATFVAFILGLGGSDESSEPLVIRDTFVVPADETGEPTTLT